jgi:hypothetical protein
MIFAPYESRRSIAHSRLGPVIRGADLHLVGLPGMVAPSAGNERLISADFHRADLI